MQKLQKLNPNTRFCYTGFNSWRDQIRLRDRNQNGHIFEGVQVDLL